MIEEQSFRSIDRALVWLQTQAQSGYCWYRGHSRADYLLVPKVFRPDCAQSENNLYRGFMRDAYALLGVHAPADYRSIDWLPLMQHYGLATRALDWSSTPLTALFFAVSDERDQLATPSADGALWLLNPTRLNEAFLYGKKGVASSDAPVMRLHMAQALAQSHDLPPPVVAFQSIRQTFRERAQRGAFTIHSVPYSLVNCNA